MELYFNSRPHGGRRKRIPAVVIKKVISTHALTEGDFAIIFSPFFLSTFQLTPSRRATYLPPFRPEWKEISTHALTEGDIQILAHCVYPVISTHALTEGDLRCLSAVHRSPSFQLTPSRRATNSRSTSQGFRLFQLTPSRRATVLGCPLLADLIFQLTPSRRATRRAVARFGYFKYFNSRPHGGRRFALHFSSSTVSFQLTPSRRATNAPITINHPILFQLTPSRRATPPSSISTSNRAFQLTPSRRATMPPHCSSRKV